MSDVLRQLVKENAKQFRDAALAQEEHTIKRAKDQKGAVGFDVLKEAQDLDNYQCQNPRKKK